MLNDNELENEEINLEAGADLKIGRQPLTGPRAEVACIAPVDAGDGLVGVGGGDLEPVVFA